MNANYLNLGDDLSLYYEESGQGPITLLLIPGWTMTTEVFSRQLECFEDSVKYRCITYDPRAHGRSSNTEGGHFYEQHGRDLNQLIVKLDLHKVVLCG